MIEDYEAINNMTDKQAADIIRNFRIQLYGGRCNGKTILQLSYSKALEKAIEKLEGGWIPVSERLPDVSERYLVSTYDDVMTDFFMGDEFMQGDYITAWQPLPEPYEKGGAE